MSHQKVLELAKKFAEKSLNEQYQQQRDQLEEFAYDFDGKLRAILNEMDGDLLTLKHKEYSRDKLKMLIPIRSKLIEMRKQLVFENPYPGITRITNYVFSKDVFPIIQELHKDIQKHLKENEVDFGHSTRMRQARVESLKNLTDLLHRANAYIMNHPLLQDPRNMPTVSPPPKSDTDPRFKAVGPDVETNPGVKVK